MAYTKTNWQDSPSTTTPINSTNLNKIENGLEKALIDYSTSEVDTGLKWTNGKPIYRKVFNFGALPNQSTKEIQHNITNLGKTIRLWGMAYRTSDSRALTIPDSGPGGEISINVSNTIIMITTQNDRSGFDDSYVIIEYIKTTD